MLSKYEPLPVSVDQNEIDIEATLRRTIRERNRHALGTAITQIMDKEGDTWSPLCTHFQHFPIAAWLA